MASVAIVIGISYAAVTLINTGVVIGAIGLLPLIASLVALAYWNQASTERTRTMTIRCLAASAVVFSITFFGRVLPQVSLQQRYDEILTPILLADKSSIEESESRPVGSFECLEPSWVFYGGRTIYELSEHSSKRSVIDERPKDWKPKPRPGLKQFMVDARGQVITREELLPRIEKVIGCPVSIVASSPYFMKKDKLVLIEWKDPISTNGSRSAKKHSGKDYK